MMRFVLLVALLGTSVATELTKETWDDAVAGKTVFIKFFAPWCGHCKAMKPDWEKLMKQFAGSKSALVAEVDCTAEGKPLCEEHGVEGFPTLKWGDASALEDYEGGRGLDELKTFAEQNLKPLCSVANLDLCDADKKKQIEGYLAMPVKELSAKAAVIEASMKEVGETFETEVKKLQEKYEALDKNKTSKIAELKNR